MTGAQAAGGGGLARAQALVEARRYAEAAPLLGTEIARDPSNPHPRCLLAQCLLGLGNVAGARTVADGAVAVDPTWSAAYRLRSVALLASGEPFAALLAAREAVRLAPDRPSSFLTLTDAELANRHLDAALRSAERARSLAPHSAEGHNALGLVALSRRRPNEAEEHFRLALRCDPEHAMALNNLGVSLLRQGHRSQAIHYFAEASKLDPRIGVSRLNAVRASKPWNVVVLVLVLLIAAGAVAGPFAALGVATVSAFPLLVTLQRRLAHGPRPDDPTASRELRRRLRKEVSPDLRVSWILRSAVAAVAVVALPISLTAAASELTKRHLVAGAVSLLVAAVAGAVLALMVRRRRDPRH